MLFGALTIPNRAVRALPRMRGWNYAAHASIEGPERAQYVADQAPQLSMTLFLHVDFCNPKRVLEALVAMGDTHYAQLLQTDDGTILGTFVVQGVADQPRWTLPDGTVLACEVNVTLSDPGLDQPLAREKEGPYATGEDSAYEYYDLDAVSDEVPAATSPSDVTSAQIVRA